MCRLRPAMAVALAWALCPGSARAVSMYDYTFDQSVYYVQPGETVTVSIYLYETVISGTTSVLMTDGIMSTGVRLSYDTTSTATAPATVTSITPAPAFTNEVDDSATTYTGSEVSAQGPGASNPVAGISVSSWSEVDATPVAGTTNQYQMLIGTVTFTAGDVVGETTVIKASDLFTDRIDTHTYATNSALDSGIYSSTAQITVVPEPATWVALVGMGLPAAVYWWGWRSRRGARGRCGPPPGGLKDR